MSWNNPNDTGSKNFKPLLVKPVLSAVASYIISKSRLPANKQQIKHARFSFLEGKSYPLVQAGVQAGSTVITEAINQYAFPDVNSSDRLALVGASSLVSSLVAGGVNVALSHAVLPDLSGNKNSSPIELFLQGVASDSVATYVGERFVYPMWNI